MLNVARTQFWLWRFMDYFVDRVGQQGLVTV
jgi:hypothetical protein